MSYFLSTDSKSKSKFTKISKAELSRIKIDGVMAQRIAREAEEKAREAREKEDEYWLKAEAPKSRAESRAKLRHEAKARKEAEAQVKKAEKRMLAEQDELILQGRKVPVVPKVTALELRIAKEVELAAIAKRMKEKKIEEERRAARELGEEDYEKIVMAKNKNVDDNDSVLEASTIDGALEILEKVNTYLIQDKIGIKSAYKEFESAALPKVKSEFPCRTHNQYLGMVRDGWKRSPLNPLRDLAKELAIKNRQRETM